MSIQFPAIRLAACGLLLFGLQAAQAASATASVSYDPAGMRNPNWTRAGSTSLTDAQEALVGTDDLPLPSGNRNPPDDMPYYPVMMAARSATDGMGANAYSAAAGIATGSASWQDTISNTSGSQRDYQMNLQFSQLSMGVSQWNPATQHNFHSGFIADIQVNGHSVWRAAQTLKVVNGAVSLSKEGFDLGNGQLYENSGNAEPYANYVSYSLDDYIGKVNLGSFASGQTANIKYTLTTFSYWDDPLGCNQYCADTSVSLFDPTHTNDRITTAPVPEPEGYAMLLAGLGLIGASMRRRG
ncbi:PEP-CTERM sorting domain-containing protein [Chitinimonas arctica]|uniref:PEP-CTERM sorting domain-containing protein n=1 Tax=Chitinimonas arctica TaxID=2594795 RepID=UPI001CC5DE5F|nr:PEP-CTERM sorting domain-containing protein [Chitinimonas arctica]